MVINEVEYKWNGTLTTRTETDLIVLHHAEANSCTAQQIHQWHLDNKWSGIGYHFFIRKDGTIYRGRPEWAIGAHAQGYNSHSLGICFEGKYMSETMPEAQIKAAQELVVYLKDKYGITDVKRHCDVNNTDCPGKNFPFDKIVNGAVIKMSTISVELPILKRGAKCNSVGTLQILLRAKGYNDSTGNQLVVDNSFGPKTEHAVRKFQQENGLEVDGACGFYTWNKLLKN